ncbi:uncharacterized protein LOC143231117 [Tachypleus tridentatus]|uniref:uncharacterized protein LOC143231117 n=1 Tax=Tachypleus tridentatus TaxID=6853 RepID=UPI003FD02004
MRHEFNLQWKNYYVKQHVFDWKEMSKSLMFSTSANSVALESSTVSSSTFNNGDSEIQHCHDDDDFAAFESAECSLSLPPHSSVGTMSSNEKLKEQFTIAFPGKVLEEKNIPKLEQVNYRDVLLGGYSSRSCKLWERLRSVEKMPESQFQWEQSQSYQQLLRSLNVDTRNILCNPSVSLSVSGLGLLELPRGPASINRYDQNLPPESLELTEGNCDVYRGFQSF